MLLIDNATFGAFSTPLLLAGGVAHAPWKVAVFGGLAAAIGSMIQLYGLRWALAADRPWLRRALPLRTRLEEGLARYRRASFLALVLVRATPVPDLPLKLVAAAGKYPVPLYGVAVWLGALPYYYLLAKLGAVFRPPLWTIAAAAAVIVAAGLVERRRRRPVTTQP